MTRPSNRPDLTRKSSPKPTARERIDALLDEALKETFPASDSSAIGSGIAVIKQEQRERKIIDQTNIVTVPTTASKPALQKTSDGAATR